MSKAQETVKAPRFTWDAKALGMVRDLTLAGRALAEIADDFSAIYGRRITFAQVEVARRRNRLNGRYITADPIIPHYDPPRLPAGDYMVSCDYHAPYYSELWVNRLLAVAERYKVKRHIIIGDLFDCDFASHYPPKEGQAPRSLDAEVAGNKPLIQALDFFDEIVLVQGNHERRPGRLTDGVIQARHLLGLFGREVIERKFKLTAYDQVSVGDWLLVHPKSYSQNSGAVAVRLAEKYHRNVCNAHGHFTALRFDRSGRYAGVDMGGLFDIKKIAYISFQTTTHPAWNPGFGMFLDGHFHLFTPLTDWDFWLKGRRG